MSDIHVTLSGNVTDDPRQYQFKDGSRVTSMRMAVNRRVLDQQTNTWQTRDTTYYTVRCFRGLADNVHQSIRKGHPVVVHGKLRIKQFERDGEQRFWAEIEASSVGHDLKWGITSFEKPMRAYTGLAPSDDDRQGMEDATKEWEMSRAAPRPVEELMRRGGHPSGRAGADLADHDEGEPGRFDADEAAVFGDRRPDAEGQADAVTDAGTDAVTDEEPGEGSPWLGQPIAA
jgi:single-strand DNA-binding protein